MNEKKNTYVSTIVLVLVVLLGGGYVYWDALPKDSSQTVVEVGGGDTASTSESSSVENTVVVNGGVNNSVSTPDLDRLIIANTFSEDVRAILAEKITSTSNALKKDITSYDLWIDLGLQRKIAEDYEGARQAWEYVSTLYPSDNVSHINLGDLYAYYLHDNEKAEKNFLTAIGNDTHEISAYFRAVDFYRDVILDINKARAIVEKGVKANPTSLELESLRSSLK